MWSHWICDTRTGTKLVKLEAVSSSFARKLNGVGTGSHGFISASIGAGPTVNARRSSRLSLTRAWARTVVQCWNDVPKYAGIITGKNVNPDGTVTLNTKEFRELLKYRTTFGKNGYGGATDNRFELPNRSLRGIADALIWDVTQGARSNWSLPMVLPTQDASGSQSRIYHEFNLPIIETELAAIQNTDGGPDVDFVPSWTDDDTLQWTPRTGDLSGDAIEWNLSVPAPALTDFEFVEDGNAQGNVFYAVGNGSDRDLKVASKFLDTDDPALERIVQYSQETRSDVLQAHATEDLRAFKQATRQYSFSMQADGTPGLPDLRLGQTMRTYTSDDDWLLDGWLEHRLVGFSGDLTNTIKLQLQGN